MKNFRQIREERSRDVIGFANAGGPEGQYDNFPKKDAIGFSNSGGSKDQYKNFPDKKLPVKENLNPRNDSEYLETDHDIFTDPVRNNEGLSNHPIKKFGLRDDNRSYGFVVPHFTNEQAKHFKSLVKNVGEYSPLHHQIIKDYTYTSHPLNHELYHSYLDGVSPPDKIKMYTNNYIHLKDMDDLIASHKLPHAVIVYSGLHFNPDEHKGKVVRFPAYTSTSLSPHVAKDFGKAHYDENDDDKVIHHIMRLTLPEGHPHLLSDPVSEFPGQSEVILPRNLRLQFGHKPTHIIKGNDFVSHFDDEPRLTTGNHEYHIWNARLLPKQK